MKKESQKELVVIEPEKPLALPRISEIWKYRELLLTFVIRDLKVRYRQTVIGGLWAILQPFTTMVVFSFFFGYIANISGDGVPYPVFSYAGLILWTYFANALAGASASVVGQSGLFTKVYFPRIIIPIAATLTGLIDYTVALTILFALMGFYGIFPPGAVVLLPFVVALTWMLAMGLGFWISAVNVKYRDIAYIMPFFIQLLMYVTPVIYPLSIAPNFRSVLMLNPMTGIMEAHRAIILGNRDVGSEAIAISIAMTIIILITGALYFRSTERKFADIV